MPQAPHTPNHPICPLAYAGVNAHCAPSHLQHRSPRPPALGADTLKRFDLGSVDEVHVARPFSRRVGQVRWRDTLSYSQLSLSKPTSSCPILPTLSPSALASLLDDILAFVVRQKPHYRRRAPLRRSISQRVGPRDCAIFSTLRPVRYGIVVKADHSGPVPPGP